MNQKQLISVTIQNVIKSAVCANIYTILLLEGPMTISELSRRSVTERTMVYRSLDKLKKYRLIHMQKIHNGYLYAAEPLDAVEQIVKANQEESNLILKRLQKLELLISSKQQDKTTKFNVYSGTEGVKQLLWNQTKASSEVVSILSSNVQSYTGKTFFKNWINVMNNKGIVSRSLVDDSFVKSQKAFYNGQFSYSLANWTARKLPASLKSPQRTTVYDETTTFFGWENGDIFGIEIINKNIASSHREYFELFWTLSTPLK